MGVFENDWIMRQISSMTDMIGKLVLHKQKVEVSIEDQLSDDEVKNYHQRIQELIKENKYREAMQYLQDHFAKGNMQYLSVALSAFDQLNALSEPDLQKGGYSRNSLYSDLEFITEQFGIHL